MTKPTNKTSMFNVNRVINEYKEDCDYWFAENRGMFETKSADLNDIIKVRDLYESSEYDKMVDLVHSMDAFPRDDIVTAMAKDCGVAFVRDTFGYDYEGYV